MQSLIQRDHPQFLPMFQRDTREHFLRHAGAFFSDKEENYLNYAKDFQKRHPDRFILQGKKSFRDFLSNL